MKYILIDQVLYWKYPGGILLKCLEKSEVDAVAVELHSGVCGGHKYWKATAFKILRAGYYWPYSFLRCVSSGQIMCGVSKVCR